MSWIRYIIGKVNIDKVILNLSASGFKALKISGIMQKGFVIRTNVGCSIKELLLDNLMIDPDNNLKSISTIFLNGEPVDDIDNTVVADESIIALSGAMPGLVGAVMRRGSFYGSFRSPTEKRKGSGNTKSRKGMVRLKLFNTVVNSFGEDFLKKGIFIKYPELISFIVEQGTDFPKRCKEIWVNGIAQSLGHFKKQAIDNKGELVFIKIKTIREKK